MTETVLPRGFSTTPPRSASQRKTDVLTLLDRERHLWLATAGPNGPHLIPLGCAWDGRRLVMATHEENLTVRNIRRRGRARAALGSVTDVVLIDGVVDVARAGDEQALEGVRADALPMDPRRAHDRVFLLLTPQRILTWRHRGELAGRTIMANGNWLA